MAEDLSRIVPRPASGKPQPADPNAGTWRDPRQYDPEFLSQVGGEAIVDVYEGLAQMPEQAYKVFRGFMERQRQKSPEGLRGTADPYDTAAYDAAVLALEGAAKEPVKTAKSAAKALAEYGKEAVSSPAGMTKFLAENLTPLPRVPSTGPVSQIVRPKGEGIVLDAPQAPPVPFTVTGTGASATTTGRVPKGYVPRAILRAQERLGKKHSTLPDANLSAINNFLQTKVRNYYTRQFGTQDDPIYKAIREGKLTSEELGGPGGIRKYLADVAKEGKTRVNPETGESRFYPSPNAQEAIQDINALYDEMTGMRGTVLAQETIGDPDYGNLLSDQAKTELQRLKDVTRDRLLGERLRPEEINPRIDYVGYRNPAFVKPGSSPTEPILSSRFNTSDDIRALLLSNPRLLPKELRTAIEKKQPIYDLNPQGALKKTLDEESLVDYLATLPVNQINNMRYEDAIRGSVKLQALQKERKALVSRIRDNKPVDGKPFLEGVSAPLVSYPEGSPLQGYTWRRLEKPDATELEGAYLKHSVGGYADDGNYPSEDKKDFRAGTIKVYSLRDPRGLPVTTVEVKEIPGLGSAVTQVKGVGRATGNALLSSLDDKELALSTNYVDPALVDLFKKLDVAAIQESDYHLPPRALAYKEAARTKPVSSLRAGIGAPQPIGRPEPPAVQQGIGQLPQAPQDIPNAENFARGMNNQQLMEFVRRLFRDQD
jgi:hypothetical protein